MPSLGLLTLAGMLPDDWSYSYREVDGDFDSAVQAVIDEGANLVAISALTPSAPTAYEFSRVLRRENVRTVFGGLHASTCPDEASGHVDAVCVGEGD